MRILRLVLFFAARLRDWALCRRYERLMVEFQAETRVQGSRLPREFQAKRVELRKRRLALELGERLDRAARETADAD